MAQVKEVSVYSSAISVFLYDNTFYSGGRNFVGNFLIIAKMADTKLIPGMSLWYMYNSYQMLKVYQIWHNQNRN